MPIDGEYEPNRWEVAAKQVERYEGSGGAEGNEIAGYPVMILTTRGRRTGKVRKAPLIKVHDGDTYIAIASFGGAPKHPVWYLNLVADPHVMVQDGPVARDYVARVAEGAERERWWKQANAVYPTYDRYQAGTERVIPVVVLEPADG
jgi:deazaflavin-dependent oxidoreductase (nitroreductase family)